MSQNILKQKKDQREMENDHKLFQIDQKETGDHRKYTQNDHKEGTNDVTA